MVKARSGEETLRRDLVRHARRLYRMGFMPGTAGNLSARLDAERLLVTPSGVSKAELRPEDIVTVSMEGEKLAGSRKVTSELGMHLAVYGRRRDAEAVVHSHPPIATAFACAGMALDEVICQEALMTIGTVPLARYATTGTEAVAASLQALLPGSEAILLANHGAVTCGTTIADAFAKMEVLEHLAHVRLLAHQLGPLRPLRKEQVHELLDAKARYLNGAVPASDADQVCYR